MIRTLWVIGLLMILMSCQVEMQEELINIGQANDQSRIESDFLLICKELPIVDLPFTVYCENCCKHPELILEQRKINNYLPEGYSLIGVVNINDAFITLLTSYSVDLIIPAILTLDLNGKIIGEKVFLGGYCGNDFEYRGQNYFSITSDLTLIEIDTSYYFKRDTETLDIIDTIKVDIETKKFKLNKQGELESI